MNGTPEDRTDELIVTETGLSPRVTGLEELPITSRRGELHRLADSMRNIIEALTSTSASEEALRAAADRLAEVEALVAELPVGQGYAGAAEAANAGPYVARARRGEEYDEDDPERYSFFDHSPFIGRANPLSPPITLRYEDDRVVGEARFGSAYEGPPGCVHGGYVAATMDELLGAAQSLSGTMGMTANLSVDYRSPTPLHSNLTLVGWLDRREGRKIFARGEIRVDGTLCAEASGLFIAFDRERFLRLLTERDERMGG